MNKATSAQSERVTNINKARKLGKSAPITVESYLPVGSWQRVTAGVAGAAVGGLVAAALVGVGPAALAGAAGYLAYRGLNGKKDKNEINFTGPRH